MDVHTGTIQVGEGIEATPPTSFTPHCWTRRILIRGRHADHHLYLEGPTARSILLPGEPEPVEETEPDPRPDLGGSDLADTAVVDIGELHLPTFEEIDDLYSPLQVRVAK